jgi:hypothetical protein
MYEMHHLPIPEKLQANISYHYYQSGHMVYVNEDVLKQFHADVAAFIKGMAIKWEKLTVKSQEAVQAAAGMRSENGNPEVLPMHLMAALLEDREGVVLPVLERWECRWSRCWRG